jgi:hypothetical protein
MKKSSRGGGERGQQGRNFGNQRKKERRTMREVL